LSTNVILITDENSSVRNIWIAGDNYTTSTFEDTPSNRDLVATQSIENLIITPLNQRISIEDARNTVILKLIEMNKFDGNEVIKYVRLESSLYLNVDNSHTRLNFKISDAGEILNIGGDN